MHCSLSGLYGDEHKILNNPNPTFHDGKNTLIVLGLIQAVIGDVLAFFLLQLSTNVSSLGLLLPSYLEVHTIQ